MISYRTCALSVALSVATGLHAQQVLAPRDSTFQAVQRRGAQVMGVDQTTSTHRFDLLADGGRITLQRDSADAAGTTTIRAHLRQLAAAFTAGDFSMPAMTHDRDVPGTATMAAKRGVIRYRMRNLPRGGEVLISTRDSAALRAIGEFIRFQRDDHRAGGMDSSMMPMHRMHHPKP
jgi:hypothetical protein